MAVHLAPAEHREELDLLSKSELIDVLWWVSEAYAEELGNEDAMPLLRRLIEHLRQQRWPL
jgi:hypothetical protein